MQERKNNVFYIFFYKLLRKMRSLFRKIHFAFLCYSPNIREFLTYMFKQRSQNNSSRKINLVFVCHRPTVWGSLKTVFEACNNDERFNITIVAVPRKIYFAQNWPFEYCETEGAEEFFKNFPCRVINGYDYKTRKWFNVKTLNPDYLFFQQPYDLFHLSYNSKLIAKYTKILYVHYASNFIANGVFETTYPQYFMKNVYMLFLQDWYDSKLLDKHFKNINVKIKTILTGFPRYDRLDKFKNCESTSWNLPKNSATRIIWTPRWNTYENNCHFFDYKDKLLEYAESHQDIDFILRPHPAAFSHWNATGELPEKEACEYKNKYEKLPNAKIDTKKEYLTTFYSSDILITDISSIVSDYMLTGNPIIYCHKTDCFNDFSRKLAKGFYWVHNWEELENTINMLKNGSDPLKEKRQQIIKECFYINPKGAGNMIKDIIVKDFYGK